MKKIIVATTIYPVSEAIKKFATFKDWELIIDVNQIKALKDVIVKKNKQLHSSQLNENEKFSYKKGKLFKLEKEQNDELYYKIII